MNYFWSKKEIYTLVELVKTTNTWIINNSKHKQWKCIDKQLNKPGEY